MSRCLHFSIAFQAGNHLKTVATAILQHYRRNICWILSPLEHEGTTYNLGRFGIWRGRLSDSGVFRLAAAARHQEVRGASPGNGPRPTFENLN